MNLVMKVVMWNCIYLSQFPRRKPSFGRVLAYDPGSEQALCLKFSESPMNDNSETFEKRHCHYVPSD